MSVPEAEQSVSSLSETSSILPDIKNSECIFDDSACGEPLVTQCISVDFTPSGDLDGDNDFVQRKCCLFWDYINTTPELKNINAKTDLDVYSHMSDSGVIQLHFPSQEPSSTTKVPTAVNTLEVAEEKGLIGRAFQTKLPKSHCNIDYLSYSNESNAGISKVHQPNNIYNNIVFKHQKPKRQTNIKSISKLREMCDKMHEWDMKHPKSMKPPGSMSLADIK